MKPKTPKETRDLANQRAQVKKLILQAENVQDLFDNKDLPVDLRALLAELLEETLYEKAREDFYTFIKIMAPEVMPEGFIDGTHIRMICQELQLLESGINKRLMIFLAPGSMKSWLCSKFYPAWCFGRNPTWNIMSIGHSTQFAEDNFGRPTKELIESDTYKRIFPATTVKSDVKAAGRWDTDQGGKYFCTGAGAKIAGRRAHLAIIDDAVDEQSADSDVLRDRINNWYGPGLRTRLLPQGRELIVNTRWHDEDISGFLLKGAKKNLKTTPWRVVSIPAILDADSAKLLGKPEGSSFWPEFWPLERLQELKADPSMTSAKWNALYMQNPVPVSGNLIKLEWCKLWTDAEAAKFGVTSDKPPPISYVIVSLDTAFSEKETADYSAYTVWGVFQRPVVLSSGKETVVPSLILLDSDKGRWSFPDLCKRVQLLYDVHKPDGVIIEKKASGQSLIQEMRRRGLPVIEFSPDTDKLNRVHACTPFFENGRIWFPDTNWAFELISDLTKFPSISKRDLVDTVSQAVLWMRDAWRISSVDDKDSDSEDFYQPKKRTYWGALIGGRS